LALDHTWSQLEWKDLAGQLLHPLTLLLMLLE
jgi:hypothetical protein